jgi:hypothetical protein
MRIHVARDGAALGIFTEAEISAGLVEGRFYRTDLAWREGMASWIPLKEWAEFSATATSPSAAEPAAFVSPSELPWETSPGLKSLFSSAWQLVTKPLVLANARLATGSVFAAAYLAIGVLFLPMVLLSPISSKVESARVMALAEWLATSESRELSEVGRGMLASVHQQQSPAWAAACGMACVIVLLPLLAAATGVFVWIGLRIQGLKVSFGRTISASIFISPLLWIIIFPLQFALVLAGTVAPTVTWLPAIFLSLVVFTLNCRATGCALSISGWRVVLAAVIWGVIGCALCCCCCGGVFAFLAGMSK